MSAAKGLSKEKRSTAGFRPPAACGWWRAVAYASTRGTRAVRSDPETDPQRSESFPEAVELRREPAGHKAWASDGARTGEALCLSSEAEDSRREATISDGRILTRSAPEESEVPPGPEDSEGADPERPTGLSGERQERPERQRSNTDPAGRRALAGPTGAQPPAQRRARALWACPRGREPALWPGYATAGPVDPRGCGRDSTPANPK